MRFIPTSRRSRVVLAAVAAIVATLVVIAGSTGWLDALGAKPSGERLARILRSPNYRDGAFQNPENTNIGEPGSTWAMLRQWLMGHEQRVPPGPMPIVTLTRADFAKPPASGLRATWLGHSTVLVEIDGARLLFDPVWARRASPSSIIGPVRFHAPPLSIEELPSLDAIVASHDHYDHLDRGVVKSLLQAPLQSNARFIVPLGVGAHLERWGVPANRITELDWSESTKAGSLTLTATPARHFSGRGITDGNHTLWASWSVAGPKHRVFHSGDTGAFAGFARVGVEHGPFDLTFIKIGAYGQTWPDIHLTPEQAVEVHTQVRGTLLLPIHWGTFNMAFHAWDEPAERVVAAAAAGTRLIVPKPGESVEPATVRDVEPWWRLVRPK
jgi:L-ascorbate metabolism protein UlaG (beta-lactamase superfamily)